MSFLKQPIFHFIVLGLLLFIGSQQIADRQGETIEALDEETVLSLRDDWIRQTGKMPSVQQLQAIQKQEIESRMLFAEALRRNYHRDDTVVLQRLLRDAEFLGIEGSDEEKIRTAMNLGVHLSDEVIKRRMVQRIERIGRLKYLAEANGDELQRLYDQDRERWLVPARYSFRHLFYSADRGDDPEQRALADLAQLNGASPTLHEAMGDPFLHGQNVGNKSLQDMTFMFGAQFSDALRADAIAPEKWFGPVPSAYGQHLLRVDEIVPERLRSFAEVKPKLLQLWRDEQERKSLQLYIDELRERYIVAAAAQAQTKGFEQ